MRMVQLCFRLPETVINKLIEIRELTNMPISDQIKLLLLGYRIVRLSDGKEILSTNVLESKPK